MIRPSISNYLNARECGIKQNINHHIIEDEKKLMKKFTLLDVRSKPNDIYQCIDHMNESVPPFQLAFSEKRKNGHLLCVADESGNVYILDTLKEKKFDINRNYRTCKENALVSWQAHDNAIFDIIWCNNDKNVVTAAGDQLAFYWDIETQKCIYSMIGHSMSVKCIRQNPLNPNLFATASRDGHVFMWDIRTSQNYKNSIINNINNNNIGRKKLNFPVLRPKTILASIHGYNDTIHVKRKRKYNQLPIRRSVTSIEFTKGGTELISAGDGDGFVKFWDLRQVSDNPVQNNLTPVREYSHISILGRRHGITSLALDSTQTKLLVSTTNSQIHLYDTLENINIPIQTFHGHINNNFYVKAMFSPDDDYIVSGSCDHNIYIWESYKRSFMDGSPTFILKGHTGEVSCVKWCPNDFTKLASCSDDTSVRIWKCKRRSSQERNNDLLYRKQIHTKHIHSNHLNINDNHEGYSTYVGHQGIHYNDPKDYDHSKDSLQQTSSSNTIINAFHSTNNLTLRDETGNKITLLDKWLQHT